TVPVAARVIGDALMPAVCAGFNVTAQGSGAAALDRRHDLELAEAQMPGMGRAIGRTSSAEDIGDLDDGAHRSGVGRRLSRYEDAQSVERTGDGPHRAGCHLGIECCRLELA